MRRLLAALAAVSLIALQAQSLAFHVHTVADAHHENENHRHGPAIHHHDVDRATHVDDGDASARGASVTIVVPVATESAEAVVSAEFTEALQAPELQLIGDARAVDVRSHGPPLDRDSFLRGPPPSAFL